MWIMTNSGFLGVVAHRDRPNDLLVRARRKGEIETIFPGADVSRTTDADYLYRSVISRTEVSSVLARQIQNIDYDNFKNSVNERELHDAYFDVWSVMHRYQTEHKDEIKVLSESCINAIPLADSSWEEILRFCDKYANEIDGYNYGDQHGGYENFLNRSEEQFEATGALPEDIHRLLVIVHLVYRRHRWAQSDTDIDVFRPIVNAILEKAIRIRKPTKLRLNL